ncbi:MAG TPA: hypothetical protein VL422_15985 [Miltoncostaea sp.]|nr:hypothetical protein [Miltoncostaea sp.]
MSAGGLRARAREHDAALVVFLWACALTLHVVPLWILFQSRIEPVLATAGLAIVLILSGATLLAPSRPQAVRGYQSWPTVAFAIGVALAVAGAAFGVWLAAAGGAVAAFGAANMVIEWRDAR